MSHRRGKAGRRQQRLATLDRQRYDDGEPARTRAWRAERGLEAL